MAAMSKRELHEEHVVVSFVDLWCCSMFPFLFLASIYLCLC